MQAPSRGLIVLLAFLTIAFDCITKVESQRQAKQAANCTNINDVLDRCSALASFSHTLPGSEYPASTAELREKCPIYNEGLQCLRHHLKCLKPMTKRAMLMFIDSRRKHVKRVCTDLQSQASRDFVNVNECVRKHKRDKFINSERHSINRIEALLSPQVKDFKERFQRSCCAINSYKARTIEDLSPQCSSPSMQAALEAAIDSVVGEAIEFACPEAKSHICGSLKELRLPNTNSSKSLTRAGSELLVALTAEDDASAKATFHREPKTRS